MRTLSLMVGLGAGCGGMVWRLVASGGIASSLSPCASAATNGKRHKISVEETNYLSDFKFLLNR